MNDTLMKTLYFIRHAKAEDKVPGQDDFQRDLASKGEQDAQLMGKKQKMQGVQPDLILSSSAIRALNTARIFAEALEYPEESIQQQEKLYEADSDQIMECIYQIPNDIHTALLFCHNPAISEAVIELSREKADLLPTCGIACFEFDVENWEDINSSNAIFAHQDFPAKGISG